MPAETAAGLPRRLDSHRRRGYLDDRGYLFMVDLIENMIITDEKNAYSARSLGEECSGQASGRAAGRSAPYPVRRESIVYGYAVRLRTHPARPASEPSASCRPLLFPVSSWLSSRTLAAW